MKIKYFTPSPLVIVITACSFLIIGCSIYLLMSGYSSLPYAVLIGIALLILIPIFRVPIYTKYSDEEIYVKYIVGGKNFKLKEYDYEPVLKKDLGVSIRLFGIGGLGGYVGWFSSSKIGKYYAIYNSTKNLLLLKNKQTGKQYIINNPFAV